MVRRYFGHSITGGILVLSLSTVPIHYRRKILLSLILLLPVNFFICARLKFRSNHSCMSTSHTLTAVSHRGPYANSGSAGKTEVVWVYSILVSSAPVTAIASKRRLCVNCRLRRWAVCIRNRRGGGRLAEDRARYSQH